MADVTDRLIGFWVFLYAPGRCSRATKTTPRPTGMSDCSHGCKRPVVKRSTTGTSRSPAICPITQSRQSGAGPPLASHGSA